MDLVEPRTMKKLNLRWAGWTLAVFCSLLAGNAAHLTFDLNDFNISGSIANRKIEMFPDARSFPRTSGGRTITADYRTFNTDTNGGYVMSNVVSGIYRLAVWGPTARPTTFYITVPNTTNMVQVDEIFGVNTGSLLYDNGLGGGGELLP